MRFSWSYLAASPLVIATTLFTGDFCTICGEIWYCPDPVFQQHMTPSLFGGYGPPQHNYCAFGSCGSHGPCIPGDHDEEEANLIEEIELGSSDAIAAVLARREFKHIMLNPQRRAIQVLARCDDRVVIAHLPLSTSQWQALSLVSD